MLFLLKAKPATHKITWVCIFQCRIAREWTLLCLYLNSQSLWSNVDTVTLYANEIIYSWCIYTMYCRLPSWYISIWLVYLFYCMAYPLYLHWQIPKILLYHCLCAPFTPSSLHMSTYKHILACCGTIIRSQWVRCSSLSGGVAVPGCCWCQIIQVLLTVTIPNFTEGLDRASGNITKHMLQARGLPFWGFFYSH